MLLSQWFPGHNTIILLGESYNNNNNLFPPQHNNSNTADLVLTVTSHLVPSWAVITINNVNFTIICLNFL